MDTQLEGLKFKKEEAAYGDSERANTEEARVDEQLEQQIALRQ